jgi:GT2 family glycosyltransferase
MIHMNQKKYISIIIVNFNGRPLLEECLPALSQLHYPKNKFEVIIVDNDSVDDSVPFMRSHFPDFKVVEAKANLGFTGGNQLGLDHAKGEYIVLLNSDVVVEPDWLEELVIAAEPKDVGLVSSRLRYAIPSVELVIKSEAVPRSQISLGIDHSPVGVLIEDIVCETDSQSNLVWYKDGFYDKTAGEVTTRRTNGLARVLIPFDVKQTEHVYKITFHGLETTENLSIPVELSLDGKSLFKIILKPYEVRQVNLTLKRSQVKNYLKWLIQNAGDIILQNGYGKDRGSMLMLRKNEVREGYEEEISYFLNPAELLSACGASCLIKRAVIDHVGFLDGHYFMYYEDLELSLRAWRAGWKIMYAPKSLAYHRHRATTGNEESAFFLEHVERNHMAFVITHFPWKVVFSEFFLFSLRFYITAVKSFIFQFKDNEHRAHVWKVKFYGRRAAFFFIIKSLPRLIKSRLSMAQYWPMNYQKLSRMVY